jgi:hypothetical protein
LLDTQFDDLALAGVFGFEAVFEARREDRAHRNLRATLDRDRTRATARALCRNDD